MNMTGYGVEVDWLRVLWHVRTAATKPTTNDVIGWINTTGYTTSNAYSKLDARANTVGGNINTNWDANKVGDGVVH